MRFSFCPAPRSAGGVLMLLLAGCTVGPDFEPPAAPATKAYMPGGADAVQSRRQRAATARDARRESVGRVVGPVPFASGSRPCCAMRSPATRRSPPRKRRSPRRASRRARRKARSFRRSISAPTPARSRMIEQSVGINQLSPLSNFYQIGPNVSYALDIFGLNKRRPSSRTRSPSIRNFSSTAPISRSPATR